MAPKKKFSSNWKKVKAGIAKLHHRIANIRKDFLHQSSNDISKNHAVVFVEDLQVKNMSKSSKGTKDQPGKQVAQKSGLNRAILDGSPFELRRQLEYKTPRDPGREPVRTAPSTGVQDRVEGRSVVSRASAEHQPHLPGILGRMRSGVGR